VTPGRAGALDVPDQAGDEGVGVVGEGRPVRAVEQHHDLQPVLEPEVEQLTGRAVDTPFGERGDAGVQESVVPRREGSRHDGVEQRLLGGDVAVDVPLRGAGCGRHLRHRGTRVSRGGEALERGLLDARPDGRLEHLCHHAGPSGGCSSQDVSGRTSAHGAASSSS
jgi:hypothetical protein